jgi:predicted TIM-barrel fold metal-dependent hydrolase
MIPAAPRNFWLERSSQKISENDRRKICSGNAAAFFGLPGRVSTLIR